VVVFVMHV